MKRPERIPDDVWDKLTVGEVVNADLLGDAALEMAEPETLCRELDSGSTLAKCLRSNVDVNHKFGHPNADEILERKIRRIRQIRAEHHDKQGQLFDLVHEFARAFHRSNQQYIRPNVGAPNSPPRLRGDICRDDMPLLPPFETVEPTDRVTVTMLYPYVSQLGEKLPVVRCSLNPHAEPAHHIECIRRLDGPPSGFQWISHPRGLNAARTRIADEVLSFDLAIGAERERAHVRAVMSEADEAMDAVMRTVREVSEGE